MSDDHVHRPTPESDIERRVRALEELLAEKNLVDGEFIDAVIDTFSNDLGPMNGAQVVARAWADDEYRTRLSDGTAAIASSANGPEGDHMVVVENTPDVHNVVVCTSAPATRGRSSASPVWYKSPPYRARMVREPRALLAEMGCDVPSDAEIRVWDSSAEMRYLVLPERPEGTDGAKEDELASLVTRDSMIGVAPVSDLLSPARAMAGPTALPRRTASSFEAPWQGGVLGMAVGLVEQLELDWDDFRQRLIAAVAEDLDRPYYESWPRPSRRWSPTSA